MSYQALARKWRPRAFADLVGQEHVVKALTNALERSRLHHAYLLTGTRGVGKTTIARIFAKSLNCETGVTATPCGTCRACVEIDGGRYVDLLELDAASNTGIDNMREILDNARYAPTGGRYKVYLIDEVHMLSRAAFNSMLKTLEEPPEHVKFILATTDPQKIPVTVLSRCLQFNLKPLPLPQIGARLEHILDAESVRHEPAAVGLLAKAAAGSLRDALSLLDQAIVHGAGSVDEQSVRSMLGAVDAGYVWRLVAALGAGDGAGVLAEVSEMAARGLSFDSALGELAGLLHRIAVTQVLPGAEVGDEGDAERIAQLADAIPAETVQLFYQIALQGRGDLALAPDEQTGFQMTLLRMLAFETSSPSAGERAAGERPASRVATGGAKGGGRPTAAVPGQVSAERVANVGDAGSEKVPARSKGTEAPAVRPAAAERGAGAEVRSPPRVSAEVPSGEVSREAVASGPTAGAEPAPGTSGGGIDDWPAFVARLNLTGMAQQLAAQSEMCACGGSELVLRIPESLKPLAERPFQERLRAAVERALGRRMRLRVELAGAVDDTLAAQERRLREDVQKSAEDAFRSEPTVRDLVSQFDARIRPGSIKPMSSQE